MVAFSRFRATFIIFLLIYLKVLPLLHQLSTADRAIIDFKLSLSIFFTAVVITKFITIAIIS